MTDDDDILAAEFALGLLDAEEGRAVQTRAQGDAALSLRIAWWRDQLAPLVSEAEMIPPDRLWDKIAAHLPVNDNDAALMRRWRVAAIAAMSIAAALALFVGTRPSVPLPGPPASRAAPMMAMLSGDKNAAVVNVSYDAATGRMTVVPAHLDIGKGDAELWIIPEDGKPRSLGVIDAKAPQGRLVGKASRSLIHPGATFAISLEVKGGSPTGQPGGPVVASGTIIHV